jgi:hypothetical protein
MCFSVLSTNALCRCSAARNTALRAAVSFVGPRRTQLECVVVEVVGRYLSRPLLDRCLDTGSGSGDRMLGVAQRVLGSSPRHQLRGQRGFLFRTTDPTMLR